VCTVWRRRCFQRDGPRRGGIPQSGRTADVAATSGGLMQREGGGSASNRQGTQIGISTTYSDGNESELIATHVDVTEHYEGKEELLRDFDEIKRSEDRLRLVIDTICRSSSGA
jgi:hypothetical protein